MSNITIIQLRSIGKGLNINGSEKCIKNDYNICLPNHKDLKYLCIYHDLKILYSCQDLYLYQELKILYIY